MLGEYKVGRCSRQCFAQQRPLREGEVYYSVIIEADEDFERRDYSAEAWQGPPEEAVGHWKCRMPKSAERKLVLAPKEVLIDLLRQMEDFPEKAKPRYLLALTMLRKRILRPAPDGEGAKVNDGMLRVQFVEDSSILEIPSCAIGRSETDELLGQLNELLYCDATELETDDEPADD
ncbi:hypothetical protein [Planctomycetes bacterium K23_9]|uniref:Uncharacterized protein n=1 Tax=Stieleria marina TaxID=1930275 RepID=A0A517P175_9BACT|nr:hypothetical protein K239x_51470 [Planctomycetes bacterium K23_9]